MFLDPILSERKRWREQRAGRGEQGAGKQHRGLSISILLLSRGWGRDSSSLCLLQISSIETPFSRGLKSPGASEAEDQAQALAPKSFAVPGHCKAALGSAVETAGRGGEKPSLEQLPPSAPGCVQHCQPPAQRDVQGAQSQVLPKEKRDSHPAEAAGCAPSLGRAHPKMLLKGEAREGLLLWETSCSCSLDCVSQSWISDACLVIPNPATEVGFF